MPLDLERKKAYDIEYEKTHKKERKMWNDNYYRTNHKIIRERQNIRGRKLYAKKRAWLNSIKDVPCIDCNNKYPPECMDFDHINNNKEFTVSKSITQMSYKKLQSEIDKCEIICANCHRIRTKERKQHG